jgi:bis(5'-nucleosyl)-tetraphosphatase (symmetrical)
MAVYAIGDVQGCYDALQSLLSTLAFDPARDVLWFTGDLVNRGDRSADVLRLVMGLPQAVSVLGNHDLHLLAVAAGRAPRKGSDTLEDVLAAPDREVLLAWLRGRPLMHRDERLGYTLIHAGVLPQWTPADAARLALEAEAVIRASDRNDLFAYMYGDHPNRWDDALTGSERIRLIINTFTRLRYCDADGNVAWQEKGPPGTQPAPYEPWFSVADRRSQEERWIFGHWSTLGVFCGSGVIGLDSGCLWGRHLTAVRLDRPVPEFTHVACRQIRRPG